METRVLFYFLIYSRLKKTCNFCLAKKKKLWKEKREKEGAVRNDMVGPQLTVSTSNSSSRTVFLTSSNNKKEEKMEFKHENFIDKRNVNKNEFIDNNYVKNEVNYQRPYLSKIWLINPNEKQENHLVYATRKNILSSLITPGHKLFSRM